MNLRSGRVKESRAIQSRGFNVKGRAKSPSPRNVLVSSDPRKRTLAQEYGVGMRDPMGVDVSLRSAYAWEMQLSDQHTRYLLIGYGRDFLYYAPAPLEMRGPRSKAAAPNVNRLFAPAPSADLLVLEVEYTEPAVNGSEVPTRDSAMGGTARNYAAAVMEPEWANARNWEWLHIVGHALGGNNEVDNLVAGTYDANTQMIPHERAIRDATNESPLVTAKWEVTLYPESWLAIDIVMTYSFIGRNGFTYVNQRFPAQTDIAFDQLQYDIWLLD